MEQVMYETYGPGGCAIVIEGLMITKTELLRKSDTYYPNRVMNWPHKARLFGHFPNKMVFMLQQLLLIYLKVIWKN
jgi:hypothetical protein